MANTIKIKNSGTSNSIPSANTLSHGELAINYRDGKIFFKDHLGGIGSFSGVTSEEPLTPSVLDQPPSDQEIRSWMGL